MVSNQPHDCDLTGIGVLVTRAEHQAKALCEVIAGLGGVPVRLPAVEINGPADSGRVDQLLATLPECDIAIFISPNAVQWGLKLLPAGGLPENLILAAVGRRTAKMLSEFSYPVDIVPVDRFDSESLLATPAMNDVTGKRVLIFRGNGGRALLGETLQQRGALVEYVEVYRRERPGVVNVSLPRDWQAEVGIATVTSNDLLDNLFSLLGTSGSPWLQATPLVVVSERMVKHARALGCRDVILAGGADEHSLVNALCAWSVTQK